MTIFTPQFDQASPGLITGYLRSEPMNGLTQQLTERGLPWAQESSPVDHWQSLPGRNE
jgi:hypothetical protein